MLNKTKNTYFLLLAFFVIFLFLSAKVIFALEVPLPGLGDNPTLPDYIVYFFKFGISIAGVIALISFAIGAVGYIISGDNPELHGSSVDRMKGAILGLVLTMASFLIINTINPQLTKPALTFLPGVEGIYVTDGKELKPTGMQNSDTSTLPAGFNQIKYACKNEAGSVQAPTLLVWVFPKPGLEAGNSDLSGVTVYRVGCDGEAPVGGSFDMDFETPGVYFLLGGSSGYSSKAITSSQDNIGIPFNKKIKAVRIVNDPANNLYYGAIFHETAGLANGGVCGKPLINNGADPSTPISVDITDASAADIFLLNKTPLTSGDGVSFYSSTFEDLTGAMCGFINIAAKDIISPSLKITYPKSSGSYPDDVKKKLCFDYTGINRIDTYKYKCSDSKCGNSVSTSPGGQEGVDCSKNACETFQDCPGSIKIKGNYLVGLYSNIYSSESDLPGVPGISINYCQTFINDVPNLKAQPFIASGGQKIDIIYIMPTK